MKGCISLLSFPSVDLLPADNCGFPVEHLSGDAVYFEGVCSGVIPDTSIECPLPTTKPPTTEPPTTKVPTTKVPTTKAATTRAPTTPLPKIETTPPVDPTEKESTPTEKLPQPVTDPKVETDPPVVTDKPETDEPETDKPETTQTVKPDPTTAAPVVIIDNETEGEGGDDDYNTVDVTDTEAATGDDENNNSVVIIICVVSAGIVVIVVLLYVGYRFHFRDKGSYKLEETKETSPNGEDFGNEYTDLNPTSKDQEWYL